MYLSKLDADGNLKRRRARLVEKGFTQVKGVDYEEVFAQVAKYTTVRIMIAYATIRKMKMLTLDVKAAFLNGKLDETIYMEQPMGYLVPGKEKLVCRLRKALYGLKQAPRAWRKSFNTFLKSIGCVQSDAESSLYTLVVHGSTMYILVYVDDVLMIAKAMTALKEVGELISKSFEARIDEDVSKFLGMIIVQDPISGCTKLHSCTMIENLLQRCGMKDCKVANTPLPEGFVLSKTMAPVNKKEADLMRQSPYRELVGCILHFSNTTRPDISFAAGYLSRFMDGPGLAHWKGAKNVVRYLKGCKSVGIVYERSKHERNTFIQRDSDSDFAGDIDGRKSTSGYCFLYGGGIVSWRSKKQTVVAQSTVEAEYIALSFAAREAIWLQKFPLDFAECPTQIGISGDNQRALCLANDEIHNDRSKHIDFKFHFIRDQVAHGNIATSYVKSSDMVADEMTKPLGKIKHSAFFVMLGMQ